MVQTELLAKSLTDCPIEGEQIVCQLLVGNYLLATESIDPAHMTLADHESDESAHRIACLMQGAIKHVIDYPCADCPNRPQ